MGKETDKRWKAFKIDWSQIETMDSEYQERKRLTQQHVAILLALLQYQKWETRWENLGLTKGELQSYIGDIEYRLMQDEGSFLMTPEEYYDAHKRATYDAWNDIAKQVVSGRTTGFNVGSDGTVTDPSTGAGDIPLPDDDPSTDYDETLAARMGGTIALLKGIEKFLDRVDTYYGATNGTPLTPAATTTLGLKLLFPCDEDLIAPAVTEYYAYRATENRILYDASATHQTYMFCKGADESAWNSLLVELSGFTAYKLATVAQLTAALAPAFWSNYFEGGVSLPSTQYLDASCVKMPYQELLNVPYASSRALVPAPAKGGHRIQIKVSGYYVDPDGDLQDAFWYRTAAGVLTRSNFSFVHSGGSNMPSDNQVPYASSHVYEYTIDLANAVSNWSVQFNRNANMNVASTSPTSGFSIEITDLGEYLL